MSSGPLGYPDFGRYQVQAATLLRNDVNVPIANSVVIGPFYVGQLQAIAAAFQFLGGPIVACQFRFSDDNAGAVTTGMRQIVSNGFSGAFTVMPVMGNWVVVTIACGAVGGGKTYTLSMQGLTWFARPADVLQQAKLQATSFVALPIGGLGVANIPYVCDSAAVCAFNSTAANIDYSLQQYDLQSASWNTVIAIPAVAGRAVGSEVGYLDAVPTRWVVSNQSGVVATVFVTLVYG